MINVDQFLSDKQDESFGKEKVLKCAFCGCEIIEGDEVEIDGHLSCPSCAQEDLA